MKRLVAVTALVLLVLGAGIAVAAIPDAQGVIHACRKVNAPDRGLLRVIDSEAGQTCPSGWAPLDWNQTGPQGPPGPTPAGALVNVHTEVSTGDLPDGTATYQGFSCPTGEVLLSASGNRQAGGSYAVPLHVLDTTPPAEPREAIFAMLNDSGQDMVYRITLICAAKAA